MSLAASLDIANSGLAAVSAQLAVVSQNIANAGTPGYIVESLGQSSQTAGGQGSGVVTGVATIAVNAQLQQDLMAQDAAVSAFSTTQNALQPINAAQGTVAGNNDLSSMLSNLDSAFSTLQNDPANVVQQSQVVNAASQLATQINTLAQSYTTARQNAQNTLVGSVGSLNAALTQIGTLSNQIIAAQQAGQSTATLQSQRSAVLQTVSSMVGITTLQQPNGGLLVMTTGGLTLPTSGNPALSIAGASVGPNSAIELGTAPPIMLGGQNVTDLLTGGSIGANVTLRDVTLPTYQGELDEFSQNLSTRFAAQGLTLFTNPSGVVPTSTAPPTQSGYVGYSLSIVVNPAVVATPSLVRDGTNAIVGSPTGASAFTPNTDPTQTGFATLIQRVLNYSFGTQVQAGVSQNTIATTGLGPAGDLSAPYTGIVSLSDASSALVGAQANDMLNVTAQLSNEQAVQSTLQAQFASTTAVNTDTELANMVQLQNAYGANARVLSGISTMFSTLMTAVGL